MAAIASSLANQVLDLHQVLRPETIGVGWWFLAHADYCVAFCGIFFRPGRRFEHQGNEHCSASPRMVGSCANVGVPNLAASGLLVHGLACGGLAWCRGGFLILDEPSTLAWPVWQTVSVACTMSQQPLTGSRIAELPAGAILGFSRSSLGLVLPPDSLPATKRVLFHSSCYHPIGTKASTGCSWRPQSESTITRWS